jgi:hypothetical protein
MTKKQPYNKIVGVTAVTPTKKDEPLRVAATECESAFSEPFVEECEVSSSGLRLNYDNHKNEPGSFGRLKLHLLQKHAKLWGVRFPAIQTICLNQGIYPPPYVLLVDVPGMNSEQAQKNPEIMRVLEAWWPGGLREIAGSGFSEVFGDASDFNKILDEWIIFLREPGEEVIDVLEEPFWLLYQREGTIIKKARTTAQIRLDRAIQRGLRMQRDNPNITHEEIITDPIFLSIWPTNKRPARTTLLRILQGKVKTKPGRRKGR